MKELLIAVLMLIAGFVFLIKGADFFVDGSSAIAKKFHVPTLIIGMTIVAMGTSLPELSVSVSASMSGSNSLAISNAIGSNLFNLLVVLGASAVISQLDVSKDVLKRDLPFSIAVTALLFVLCLMGRELGHIDGAILMVVFVAFLVIMVKAAASSRKEASEEEEDNGDISVLKSVIYIIGGAVAIKIGGDWVVDSAVVIARTFGVSETLIGLTIVACGTSLPELVTSMVAAKKNELDMAVGNVVGSNIFNILLILGCAAAISPVAVINENLFDIGFLAAMSIIVMVFGLTKKKIERYEGAALLLLYGGYLVYIIMR